MKHRAFMFGFALFATCTLMTPQAQAVTLNQIDTFEDGTTLGWGVGGASPLPPVNIASGGPHGTGDHYLQMTATGGGGPGSKLVAFNTDQWAGDYLTAGINLITLDVENLGTSALSLRLSFDGPGGLAYSKTPVLLPAGAGWTSIRFSLDTSSLSGPLSALSGTNEVRLFHSPSGGTATSVAGRIGVDNLRATAATPAPSSAIILGVGFLGVFGIKHRSRKEA